MLEVKTAAVLVQRSSKRVTEHPDWLLKQIPVAEVNGGPKNVVVKNPFMPLILACLRIIRHDLGRVWLKQQHAIRSFGTRILRSQPCCTKLGATGLFQLTSYPPPHHGPPPFKRPLHGVRLGNRLTKAVVSVQFHWDLHRDGPSPVRCADMIETSKGSFQRETVSCHHYPGPINSRAATAAVLGTDVVLAPFTWGWVLVAVSAFWGADGGGWWLLYLPPWGLDRNLLRVLAFRPQTLPWIHQKR